MYFQVQGTFRRSQVQQGSGGLRGVPLPPGRPQCSFPTPELRDRRSCPLQLPVGHGRNCGAPARPQRDRTILILKQSCFRCRSFFIQAKLIFVSLSGPSFSSQSGLVTLSGDRYLQMLIARKAFMTEKKLNFLFVLMFFFKHITQSRAGFELESLGPKLTISTSTH